MVYNLLDAWNIGRTVKKGCRPAGKISNNFQKVKLLAL
jgi:hypothetical protein